MPTSRTEMAVTVRWRSSGSREAVPANPSVAPAHVHARSGSIFFTRQCIKGMAPSKVLRSAELALEAAMTGSFDTAVRAIACDPLVMSLSDARDLARDLIALEEDDLDPRWDAPRPSPRRRK
jgi:hypothetical protein